MDMFAKLYDNVHEYGGHCELWH